MAKFSLEFETDRGPLRQEYSSSSVAIGRDPSSDIHLDHPTVSRQHALIIEHPSGYTLIVLSQNGLTAIDGQAIASQAELADGVMLNFGQVRALFASSHASPRTAPLPSIGHFPPTEVPTHPAVSAGIQHEARTAAMPVLSGGGEYGQPGGFGSPAPGFGQQPDTGNFPQPGFGQPSGFGQQPGFGQPSGFGQQSGTGNSAQPTFGQGTHAPPSVGQPAVAQPIAGPGPPGQAHTTHGILSWDQIAAQEDTNKDSKEETHYQRLQDAQKKAGASQSNPIVLVVGAIGLIGMMYLLFFYDDKPQDFKPTKGPRGEIARVIYEENDFSCSSPEECLENGKNRYRIGSENLRRKEVDVGNLFMAYLNLDMAEKFFEASELPIPEDMKDLEAKREEAAVGLDDKERDLKVRYHQAKQKSQHQEMYQVLVETRAFFPDKRSREHQWAEGQETIMKVNGIMPKAPKKKGKKR